MLSRPVVSVALVALVSTSVVHAGCVGDGIDTISGTEDAGGGDGEPGTPPPDAGSLDPDATAPTGCPLGCLPPAPAGWTGPSAVYDGPPGTKPAACPSSNCAQLEVEAHQGMTATAAVCDCGTATVKDAFCSAGVETWSGSGCSGTAIFQGTAKSNGGCLTSSDGASSTLKVTTPTLNRGKCEYPNPTETLQAPTFAKADVACGLPQLGVCEGRSDCTAAPLPEAPFTRVCIHKEGEVACPSADYAHRFVAYKKLVDERGCAACEGTPTGGTCGTKWGRGTNVLSCDVAIAPTTYDANACITNPGNNALIDIRAMAPTSISCNLTAGGAPTGQAASEEPVTFCCSK